MLEVIIERANYWAIIGLMMLGLYITFEATNMIKRLVGLSIFQTSVFLLYITLGKVVGGTAPILFGDDVGKHGDDKGHGEAAAEHGAEAASAAAHGASDAAHHGGDAASVTASLTEVYSNPLPHVLILTAIVVGVATLSVGLAIVVRIREVYGTIEADDIREIDIETALKEDAADPELAGA